MITPEFILISSVTQSCPTLCNTIDCSTPDFPGHHQLQEFKLMSTESVIPSNISSSVVPFSSCLLSFPASRSFLMSQFFTSSGQSVRVPPSASVPPMNTRTGLLQDGLVGSPCSPRDSQEHSLTPQFKSISSLALSFLQSPTLTFIHDYWKNHSFDQINLCWQIMSPLFIKLNWS